MDFNSLWSEFRKIEQRGLHGFKRELTLIGKQLDVLSQVFTEVHTQFSHDQSLKEIWLFHIAKTMTSIEGALTTSLRGLFSESANLIRVGLESAWQLFYLHDLPEMRHKWIDNVKIEVSKVRKHLEESETRRLVYDEFCRVSHPRKEGAEWYYMNVEGYVRFGPAYEPQYVKSHLYTICRFIGWIQEDIIKRLFPNTFGHPLTEPIPLIVKSYVENRAEHKALYNGSDIEEKN